VLWQGNFRTPIALRDGMNLDDFDPVVAAQQRRRQIEIVEISAPDAVNCVQNQTMEKKESHVQNRVLTVNGRESSSFPLQRFACYGLRDSKYLKPKITDLPSRKNQGQHPTF